MTMRTIKKIRKEVDLQATKLVDEFIAGPASGLEADIIACLILANGCISRALESLEKLKAGKKNRAASRRKA